MYGPTEPNFASPDYRKKRGERGNQERGERGNQERGERGNQNERGRKERESKRERECNPKVSADFVISVLRAQRAHFQFFADFSKS